ncbi:MAG: amidohydrolase family protein [Burkholderiaceae bacterium]|nr:amidohydrolase family protein [Burkholderiaceae bacterium]
MCALSCPLVRADTVLLRPAGVWTADNDAPRSGWVVLVEGERIAAVGAPADVHVPADSKIIDLPGMTLLPGLIDLHSHVFLHPYNETPWNDQVLREPLPYRTLEAGVHAKATLLSGFTTLRDLGTEGAGNADYWVKRAIDEGMIPGPRLFVATRAIVATGTYGPARRTFSSDADIPQGAQEASGTEEAMRAAREQIAAGADWVKLYADYRWGPGGALAPTFSEEEIKAIVAVAHDAGRKVAVHAMSDEGMRRAAMAGVDTIEHGYNGSAATFKLMAERGVAFLPTLTAEEAVSQYFQHYVPGQSQPTEGMKQAAHAFELARKAGVTIGCGSDVGVFAHGTNYREVEWMARLGMTPVQALKAATSVAARILGKQDEFGRVAAGLRADLIAVADDPTQKLETIEHVAFVMKNGQVYKQP